MKKIPYWHQTSGASCGPSCLLMLFNYLDSSYSLTRENEWNIWRDASMLSWRGCHPYGLAIASLKRGFKVTLFREKKAVWKDVKFSKNNESVKYSIKEQEENAKKLGLIEKFVRIDLSLLNKLLGKHFLPILLMRHLRKNRTLGFFHWVVLTKIENDYVIINDPEEKGDRKIPLKFFMKAWDKARDSKWGTAKEVLIIEK